MSDIGACDNLTQISFYGRKSDISKRLVYSHSIKGIWKSAGNVSPLIVLACNN